MPRPQGHGPNYEIRRQQIIDIAAGLFARNGYATTGILELCDATGLAKGALYYYIGSKEDLLVDIQDRVMTPLLEVTRSITKLHADPVVRLRLISEALLTIIFERHDHIWVYEHDYRELSESNLTKFMRHRRQFERVIESVLTEAMDVGMFRDMDARLATLQFLNLHNHTYRWAHVGGKWDARVLSHAYCQLVLTGFAAEHQLLDHVDAAADEILATHPELFQPLNP